MLARIGDHVLESCAERVDGHVGAVGRCEPVAGGVVDSGAEVGHSEERTLNSDGKLDIRDMLMDDVDPVDEGLVDRSTEVYDSRQIDVEEGGDVVGDESDEAGNHQGVRNVNVRSA